MASLGDKRVMSSSGCHKSTSNRCNICTSRQTAEIPLDEEAYRRVKSWGLSMKRGSTGGEIIVRGLEDEKIVAGVIGILFSLCSKGSNNVTAN
jgi:hypothetical protein